MARLALGIEYDGSAFAGWQSQRHARSVQGELEQALARVADHPVALVAAGRTDAGVHALEMVAHFDTGAARALQAWVLGTNANAADDVTVLWAHPVPDAFDARRAAQARRYTYRILDRRLRPALERHRVCWVRTELDVAAMSEAAQALLGHHDFSSFRAAECQSSTPMRDLSGVAVERNGPYVDIRLRANAFLHHMVRNIAGSLILIGRGERSVEWLGEVLRLRDRTRAGPTAPPQGLYFAGAEYPVGFGLPSYKLLRPHWRA
ncbi:MAG TPA: tRNA pseudouridine(38-40) synthase TruA [Steroidobacteraceae bacterium]|jgi:tRNA pseudouridine38-40 synthase|nr:tRNA pseudouridine(38-40) synthase TruA [Steroidobacteraceae bacterium]